MTSTWKNNEQRICEMFVSLPPKEKECMLQELSEMRDSARAKKEGSRGNDCKFWLTEPFSVSVKDGKQVPITPYNWMQEAIAVAPKDSLPVLVMHPKGKPLKDSLVTIPLHVFIDWYVG